VRYVIYIYDVSRLRVKMPRKQPPEFVDLYIMTNILTNGL
jgi:hypothetical protein